MSVIYDALKKAENPDNSGKPVTPPPDGKKPKLDKRFFSLLAIILLIVGVLAGLFYVSLKMKHMVIKPQWGSLANKAQATGTTNRKQLFNTYVLEGIIFDKEQPIAIVNGKVIKVGESIDSLQVKSISRKSVELIDPQDGSTSTISLQ